VVLLLAYFKRFSHQPGAALTFSQFGLLFLKHHLVPVGNFTNTWLRPLIHVYNGFSAIVCFIPKKTIQVFISS
jgi:hypothetical protein